MITVEVEVCHSASRIWDGQVTFVNLEAVQEVTR